jgi:hypothetical protein
MEKVLSSCAKVGFVPFNCRCLENPKVRNELGQDERNEGLESLQVLFDEVIGGIKSVGRGFNPGIFDASIPVAVCLKRAETEALRVEELLKIVKAFSVNGI